MRTGQQGKNTNSCPLQKVCTCCLSAAAADQRTHRQ